MDALNIVDPGTPPTRCAYPRAVVRAKPIGGAKADPIWDVALQPKFKTPVREGLVAPHGTTKPHGLTAYLDRVAEIRDLIRTQHLDLPSLSQEFSANGLSAMSLSSSPEASNDDDLEAANLAEKHLGLVPYKWDPETLAPLLRRIEWEKFIFACGQSVRIYAKKTESGRTLACNDRRWTGDQLTAFIPKVLALLGERSMDDIENARDRAAHYKRLVWSLMTPDQQAAWSRREPAVLDYLNPATAETNLVDWTEDTSDGGPQELGLHDLDSERFDDGLPVAAYEPSERYLWPESEEAQDQLSA